MFSALSGRRRGIAAMVCGAAVLLAVPACSAGSEPGSAPGDQQNAGSGSGDLEFAEQARYGLDFEGATTAAALGDRIWVHSYDRDGAYIHGLTADAWAVDNPLDEANTVRIDNPIADVTTGAGSVWVATVNPRKKVPNCLKRIDPDSGEVLQEYGFGDDIACENIVFGFGAVWMDIPDGVVRLDAETGEEQVIEFASDADVDTDILLAVGPDAVYAATDTELIAIDPAAGAISARTSLGEAPLHPGLVAGPTGVWVVDTDWQGNRVELLRYDSRTLQTQAQLDGEFDGDDILAGTLTPYQGRLLALTTGGIMIAWNLDAANGAQPADLMYGPTGFDFGEDFYEMFAAGDQLFLVGSDSLRRIDPANIPG